MKIINLLLIVFSLLLLYCNNNHSSKNDNKNKDITGNKTFNNLKSLINLEYLNSKKYGQFSNKARLEGYSSVSKLFLAFAKSESINSMIYSHFLSNSGIKYTPSSELAGINSTKENIENSLSFINSNLYKTIPEYIKIAGEEKLFNVQSLLSWTVDIETKQKNILENAKKLIDSGNESSLLTQFYICPKCGNIYFPGNIPDYCELCMTYKGNFILII